MTILDDPEDNCSAQSITILLQVQYYYTSQCQTLVVSDGQNAIKTDPGLLGQRIDPDPDRFCQILEKCWVGIRTKQGIFSGALSGQK